MGVAVGKGVVVDVEVTVGVGMTVGARVAVDVGVAACAPVQPDKARQKAIQATKIRSFFILIITSRGMGNKRIFWMVLSAQRLAAQPAPRLPSRSITARFCSSSGDGLRNDGAMSIGDLPMR